MKERKKDIYNILSPPSNTRECFCTAGSQLSCQPPSRWRKEAEQRWWGMRGVCAMCCVYLCEMYVDTYMQVKSALKWWKRHENAINMEKAGGLWMWGWCCKIFWAFRAKPPTAGSAQRKIGGDRGKGIRNLQQWVQSLLNVSMKHMGVT